MKKPVETVLAESDVYPGAKPPRLAPAVLGHNAAQREMLDAYRSGRLAHAWLIGGPEGVGKATLAWAFARFVLAYPDIRDPRAMAATDLSVPESNPAARQVAALSHPDLAVIRRAANPKSKGFFTEIRVEDVRAGQSIFQLASAFGGWRVMLIDSADDLNRAGANALLKTIEEPPQRALILIVAHRPGRLPPTIRSRCRRLTLGPLESVDIETIVAAQGPPFDADRQALRAAALAADGSVREVLRRLDPELADTNRLIDTLVAALPAVDWRTGLKLADRFGAGGAETHERFTLALHDWVAARARVAGSAASRELLTDLWAQIRRGSRDAERLNLDRKTHAFACLQEIAERGRAL